MAHLGFAQRAWLPPERACGLVGPAFPTGGLSVVVGVQAPVPEGGRQGRSPARSASPTQSRGCGCGWSPGAAQRSGGGREGEGRH